MESFKILLDRENGIYNVGEEVTGRVVININERLKVNSVKILAFGEGRVSWSETVSTGKGSFAIPYRAKETYLEQNIVFISTQPNNDLYLEFGEHVHPFRVLLPPTLPTSFEHEHSRIRYSLKATLDIPWSFNKHVKLSFSVINPVDLNLNPILKKPFNATDSRQLCCWCCKSDPIKLTFSVNKTGFVPGENIAFKVLIHNSSGRTIKDIQVRLKQDVTLHATMKTRTWPRDVDSVAFEKDVAQNSFEEWLGSLLVPSVCASFNQTSKIIIVDYYLSLTIDPTGPNLDISLPISIQIGTIPLKMSNEDSNYCYEASMFTPNDNQELDQETEGELNNLDVNYKPSYQFYKDFSIVSR